MVTAIAAKGLSRQGIPVHTGQHSHGPMGWLVGGGVGDPRCWVMTLMPEADHREVLATLATLAIVETPITVASP